MQLPARDTRNIEKAAEEAGRTTRPGPQHPTAADQASLDTD